MDIIRNKYVQKNIYRNQLGQSTIEYILLFVIVVSIASIVLGKDSRFNKLFGQNGQIAQSYKKQLEFSYRHGYISPEEIGPEDYSGGDHKSYSGRFFGAKDTYPSE